jgi:hypothetical protein
MLGVFYVKNVKNERIFLALYLLHGPTGVLGYSNTTKTHTET